MPVIEADGLFGGDRFDMMTDEARLYWPYFWCASNTVGRIELNYLKFVAKAFYRFKKPLAEGKFWDIVAQYRDAYLLFCYEHNGQLWGQWDTSEKFLPRHKLAADERTPAPLAGDFIQWKREYVATKSAKSINVTNFGNFAKSCASLRGNVRGIGVGGGVGGGKILAAPAGAEADNSTPPEPPKEPQAIDSKKPDEVLLWFDDQFWPLYPRKVGKPEALKAARKVASTPEKRTEIMAGLNRLLPEYLARDGTYVKHPGPWLNGERWNDPLTQTASIPKPSYDPTSTSNSPLTDYY